MGNMKPPVTKITTKVPIPSGTIRLTHTQTVRQSANYQSAEVSYGAEIEVPNNPIAIKNGVAYLERTIEGPLVEKLGQHRKLLAKLGDARG